MLGILPKSHTFYHKSSTALLLLCLLFVFLLVSVQIFLCMQTWFLHSSSWTEANTNVFTLSYTKLSDWEIRHVKFLQAVLIISYIFDFFRWSEVDKQIMAPNNPMPIWGNEKTMNLNPLILTNIQSSPYFKVNLYELKTYHEVIDEIYYRVSISNTFWHTCAVN